MPARKLTKPTKAVTFRITEDLAAKLELLLLDPVANRTSYGKKSMIVETLLHRLIVAVQTNTSMISVADLLQHFQIKEADDADV